MPTNLFILKVSKLLIIKFELAATITPTGRTCSKAKFKIGISNYNQKLNDFIIDINPRFTDIFAKELKKYLKGLNKID